MRGPFSDVQLVSAIVRTTARMIGRKPPVCTVGASFFSLSLTFPSFYEKPGFGSGGEGGREGASSIPLYPPCPGAAVGVGRGAMEAVSSIHIIVRARVHLWSRKENAEEGGGAAPSQTKLGEGKGRLISNLSETYQLAAQSHTRLQNAGQNHILRLCGLFLFLLLVMWDLPIIIFF